MRLKAGDRDSGSTELCGGRGPLVFWILLLGLTWASPAQRRGGGGLGLQGPQPQESLSDSGTGEEGDEEVRQVRAWPRLPQSVGRVWGSGRYPPLSQALLSSLPLNSGHRNTFNVTTHLMFPERLLTSHPAARPPGSVQTKCNSLSPKMLAPGVSGACMARGMTNPPAPGLCPREFLPHKQLREPPNLGKTEGLGKKAGVWPFPSGLCHDKAQERASWLGFWDESKT